MSKWLDYSNWIFGQRLDFWNNLDYAFKMKLLSQLNPLSSAKSKKFPEKLADAFTRKTKKKLESPKTLKWKQYIRIIPRQTYCRWCKNWQTFFVLLQLFLGFSGIADFFWVVDTFSKDTCIQMKEMNWHFTNIKSDWLTTWKSNFIQKVD